MFVMPFTMTTDIIITGKKVILDKKDFDELIGPALINSCTKTNKNPNHWVLFYANLKKKEFLYRSSE